jgi:hypothetical protein
MNQIGLVGIVNYLGFGGGLEYTRRSFTWMDWGLQVSSTQADLTESKNPDTDEFLTSSMTTARVTARFFNNRWLSLGTSLGFNNLQGTYGWKGAGVINEKISTDFTAQMILFDLSLSSQWEFGSFYIGADWFGFGVPIASGIEHDTNKDLDDLTRVLTGSDVDERIQNELTVQFRPFYMLLKFGYMF